MIEKGILSLLSTAKNRSELEIVQNESELSPNPWKHDFQNNACFYLYMTLLKINCFLSQRYCAED